MTDRELTEAFGALRILCTNIIGFHVLTEQDSAPLHPVDRVMFEAQVYSGGLALAYKVHQIADELESRA